MKFRGLIIAVVVLAALAGALYWSNRHPPADETAKISADAAPKILALNQNDIVRIEIAETGKDALVLSKNSSDKWQITAPKPFGADQDAVTSLASSVASLNSDRLIADKAVDVKQYGLDAPAVKVSIEEKDNKTQELLIGDATPTGSDVYAMLAGDPRVFTLSTSVKSSLDKGVNDLRDKRLLTLDPDKISQVELITKKQDIEFGRSKDAWQILKPKPLRADSMLVDDLVRRLTDAKMDLTVSPADESKAASMFAAGAPVVTAKVTSESGMQELEIRKNKDDYYAKSSAVAGVYKAPSDLGQGLDKNVGDFRNKKLFDFGFDDPNSIEMHDGPKTYFLTRTGADWLSNGKKMDAASVEALVEQIRGLSATKFVDSGFTAPVMDISVSSSDGKVTEKVLIAKSGDGYIAERENEAGLYELGADIIQELQKAASDVTPAATPAKK